MKSPHQVVIVGGGFGGLHAAQSLKDAPVEITLLDRSNFHLFQPLLYQVATGWLSPANIASPLRHILNRQRNVRVLLAEVTGFDVQNRQVLLKDDEIGYDTLIVAAGSRHHYFGNNQWEKHAPGLKTIEEATEIRRRILLAFEAAERETDPHQTAAWLTFLVIGGGPTGVELAGALVEIAKDTLKGDFRNINPASARILLVEGLERILPTYPPSLSARGQAALENLGVTVLTRTLVTDVQADAVSLRSGDRTETVPTRTLIWAAGVRASTLSPRLAEATGAELDPLGRIVVQPDLSLTNHPEIFVIGDMAHILDATGNPLPATAPPAMQQGRYVAQCIRARLRGESLPPFRYRDFGFMATIGRGAAVAKLGRFNLWGFPAWLTWLFVHLLYLVGFQNRLLVLIQWAWSYFTRNRSARLIVGR